MNFEKAIYNLKLDLINTFDINNNLKYSTSENGFCYGFCTFQYTTELFDLRNIQYHYSMANSGYNRESLIVNISTAYDLFRYECLKNRSLNEIISSCDITWPIHDNTNEYLISYNISDCVSISLRQYYLGEPIYLMTSEDSVIDSFTKNISTSVKESSLILFKIIKIQEHNNIDEPINTEIFSKYYNLEILGELNSDRCPERIRQAYIKNYLTL